MISKMDKNKDRKVRHARARKNVFGTAERPRMNVYRSLNNIYVQIIDDSVGRTLCSCSTAEAELKKMAAEMTKREASKLVGKTIAQRAIDKGIKTVVFDRGGYLYTGRVAEVAAGAREAGLEF
ncbi:MAG TPA: 50S ribosomal protein L18 [Clostridia bacterium]|nr:50S ribosomal protein L18 [Clostridia bacterium]